MSYTNIILRLIHIFAGVFWAGSLFFFARLLSPALRATGASGDRVAQDLVANRGIGKIIPITAVLTVLSGLTMYYRFVTGSQGAYGHSRAGMVFGIGGVAAILGLVAGAVLIGPSMEKVVHIQLAAEAAGRPLTEAENQAIGAARGRAALGTKIALPFLVIAVGAMAIGRYV